MSVCLYACLSYIMSVCLYACLSYIMSVCLYACLSYIMSVCLYACLSYPACKAHAPYYIVFCGLSGCTVLFHSIS
jgi:hypothetical protein